MTNSWPLFIPVLLTLADDNSTSVRRRGLVILKKFLDKFPNKILNQTGLNKVFEDTVLPTLSYLPSITPEEESVQLLGPAYAVLRRLAAKLSGEKKNKLLDRVVREGILLGYFHAKEYVRIVEVLCREMGEVLVEMGVNAVKHLKVRGIYSVPLMLMRGRPKLNMTKGEREDRKTETMLTIRVVKFRNRVSSPCSRQS